MNEWAKKNSLKKSQGTSRNTSSKTPILKATYSSCPKGSSIESFDDEGHPTECRSSTGTLFSPTSSYQERYPNGNPKTQLVYSKNSLLKMKWHPNGFPEEQVTYEQSEKNGPFKKWFKNGVLNESGSYLNEKLSGPYLLNDQRGQVKQKGRFRNGKKVGVWITKGSNQNTSNQNTSNQGATYQGASNQGMARETYKSGLLDGNAEYLNKKGKLYLHGSYQGGLKVGKWLQYHPNGKWMLSGSYNPQGKKNGAWSSYDINGKILSVQHYSNGRIVRKPTLAANLGFSKGDTLGARPPQFRTENQRTVPTAAPTKKKSSWAPL